MCTNYAAARRRIFEKYYGALPPADDWRDEIYQDYPAPLLRRASDGSREARLATFGMVPKAKASQDARRYTTMNARAETLGDRPTYRSAWAKQQLCLIPCEAFFEPNYESGKHVRFRIGMASGEPFAVAGLWRAWPKPDGEDVSFTMLTVNADEHPLMRRFHKPGDEKRSVVIVRPEDYDDWLACKSTDEARSFLQLFPSELMVAEEAPKVVAPRQ